MNLVLVVKFDVPPDEIEDTMRSALDVIRPQFRDTAQGVHVAIQQSADHIMDAVAPNWRDSYITPSSSFAPTPPPSGGAASPRVHAQPPKHVVPGDNSDTGGET